MESYDEKRKHERFGLYLPCLIMMDDDGVMSEGIELSTKNLSAGGALLETSEGAVIHGSVTLDIIIPPRIIKCNGSGGTYITASGSIVRSANREAAVSFKGEYQIAPLNQVLQFIRKKVAWIEQQSILMDSERRVDLLSLSKSYNGQNNDPVRLEKV